jgi:membrane-bound serine protease (ClpP class)
MARSMARLLGFGAAAGALLLGAAILATPHAVSQAPAAKKPVAILGIEGPIGPATGDYLARGIREAHARNAGAVVLRIDTPGGLASTMREVIRDIIASPIPVIGYVAPGGAHAASAGTYILYATHLAAMSPGTNLGAATPVQLRPPIPGIGAPPRETERDSGTEKGEDGKKKDSPATAPPSDAASQKAINDARAYIRSLAQMRGRNVEWAERSVSEAAALSAEEALKEKVIDLIARDIPDLLAKAHGRTVRIDETDVRLDTSGAPTFAIEPDWRSRFLATITDPNIAYILLLIGIYGLIFEFYSPGIIFSGVIGAICLVLALYALHVLPVNYAGLGLILLGIAFMLAEAFVPAFGVLGIGGIIALVIGSIILLDTEAPGFGLSWTVIGAVAATSALLTFAIIGFAARAWRRPVVSGREAMVGASGRVVEWSGAQGMVRVHGELWQARADGPLAPGDAVTVTAIDRLVLTVRAGGGET